MTAAVRRICRTCRAEVLIATCHDGELRGFNAAPSPGDGWWWSSRRGGMVAPDDTPFHPVATYRVHRCHETASASTNGQHPTAPVGPGGQLALFDPHTIALVDEQPTPLRRAR